MRTGFQPIHPTLLDRLRWTIVNSWTITKRDLLHWVRQPFTIVIGLLFPVMVVLIFAYLFGGGMAVPAGANYREILMPGMFAMTMLFGIETTFAAVATDAARGVTDRFRSMPMHASAVLIGRACADMLNSTLGLAIMLLCGLAVGWRWHNGIGPALLAVLLLLLLRFAMLWLGIFLGLVARSPDALVAVQILVWPIGFLSNAFAPPDSMPGWIATIAEWNPLSSTVAATRLLFGNPGWGGNSWIAQHSLLMALVWPLLLLAIFFPLSVRRYRRLDR